MGGGGSVIAGGQDLVVGVVVVGVVARVWKVPGVGDGGYLSRKGCDRNLEAAYSGGLSLDNAKNGVEGCLDFVDLFPVVVNTVTYVVHNHSAVFVAIVGQFIHGAVVRGVW